MSDPSARQGVGDGARPTMTRRKALHLGVASAAAASAGLPWARRAAAQIGGAQPAAPAAPAGELKNPAEFKAPRVKASAPTTLSFWQYVGFHVTVQRFIADEYKKRFDPERHPGDHRVPRPQRAARRREVRAGRPEPRAGHHRRGAGGLRGRRVHQRQRARLRQGLRPGSGLPARVLAQRHRAPDHQRRGRLRPRRDQHGDRLLQQGTVRPARARGPPDPGRAEEDRRRPRAPRASRPSPIRPDRTGTSPSSPSTRTPAAPGPTSSCARRTSAGGPGRARSWWPPRSSWR